MKNQFFKNIVYAIMKKLWCRIFYHLHESKIIKLKKIYITKHSNLSFTSSCTSHLSLQFSTVTYFIYFKYIFVLYATRKQSFVVIIYKNFVKPFTVSLVVFNFPNLSNYNLSLHLCEDLFYEPVTYCLVIIQPNIIK